MKPANTSKVHFKSLMLSDVTAFHSGAFGVAEVSKYLQWDAHKNEEETKVLIEEMIDLHKNKMKYFWVAKCSKDKRIVGLGSIKPEENTSWIGFLVFHREQRKGFGSTILNSLEVTTLEMYDYASASVDPLNLASINLLKKRGWVESDDDSVHPLRAYRKNKANKSMDLTNKPAV